jgi:hypothetical protein
MRTIDPDYSSRNLDMELGQPAKKRLLPHAIMVASILALGLQLSAILKQQLQHRVVPVPCICKEVLRR